MILLNVNLGLIFFIQFMYSNNDFSSQEVSIHGKWRVVGASYLPFPHISNCDELGLNSIFHFEKNGKLVVYPSESEERCNESQSYLNNGKNIEVFESDMVFRYKIQLLTEDSLRLVTRHVPTCFWTKLNLSEEKNQQKLNEIRKEGISLTLLKEAE